MFGRDPRELLAVFAGGAIGTAARAVLGVRLVHGEASWPWATLIVNIVAAFALGYFSTRLLERLPVSNYRRPFLGTGICGGLSTFSTMNVEIVQLLQAHAWAVAAGYALASLVGGLVAVHLGTQVVRRVVTRW
jgi:CrcB protein